MARTTTLLLTCAAVLALATACGSGSVATVPLVPTITEIEPASGGTAGGTPLTIRGTNLANKTTGTYEIWIGGQAALEINVVDSGEVECKSPPGTTGPVDVEIVTNEGTGLAASGFTYYPAPTIFGLDPDAGSRDGGLFTTVTGTGFTANNPGDTICLIGNKPLTNIEVVNDTTLTGFSPTSWTEVAKDVVVVNRNGQDTLPGGWLYFGPIPLMISIAPVQGIKVGGYSVTISGLHFTEAGGVLDVKFGDTPATDVTRVEPWDQALTCTVPPGLASGWVDVSVGNSNGTSMRTNFFYYIPPPEPTSITPNSGSIDGGTPVEILGSGFDIPGTTNVYFDGALATSVAVVDDGKITCVTPAGSTFGLVGFVVENDSGLGPLPDSFTYGAPDFWWENTLGAEHGSPGDGVAYNVALPNGFPFFGTTWSAVYAVSDFHLDFPATGAPDTFFPNANNLFAFPHISVVANDGNTSSGRNIHATSHVPNRTVITYNDVPEWSATGSNNFQVHLHASGSFGIVFKGMTSHLGTINPYGLLAVNPGNGSSVSVDFTAGIHVGGSGDALNEQFSGTTDLQNGVLTCIPNSGGGYTSSWSSGVPPDPNP